MKGFSYIIAVFIIGLLVHPASAQMIEELKGKRGPVHITSQRLEAEYEKKLITFIGDVVAKQEEFTIYADRLFLFLNKNGGERGGIDKIVAQGNVRMVQANRTVRCQEATYYYQEGTLVLGGSERVTITIKPDMEKQ